MKIYIADFGWAGCIFVVANSLEEAKEFMKQDYDVANSYNNMNPPIDEYEITNGFIYSNSGDL